MQTLTQKTFFLNTEVAISYKTSKQNINSTKNYHADELIENIHYFYDYEQTKGGRQRVIKWTLEGVYKLFDKIKKLKERSKMAEEKENIVKKVCKELNITQAELGRQLDVPASTINTWASGKIPKMAEVALTLMLENKQQKEILEAIKKARDFIDRI
ncbi:TPA: helix-turn-helix domain-containing protein [Campylobacter coli]